jgi:ATP-dependent RNA helicase RhlE
MALLPKIRQTLLFSATFSAEICQLTKAFLNKPVEVSVTPRNATAPTVKQWVHPVDKVRKPALLSLLIRKHDWAQGLVFTRTKHGANKLVLTLAEYGIESAAIHGNKSQSQRTKALADFKQGKLHILVATDIAARGIDIDNLPVVINYDLPQVAEDYVHRIGRAGRAGVDGSAVSLVSFDELSQLQSIERVIKSKLEKIIVDDFAPIHTAQTLPAKNKPVKVQAKSYSAQANRQNRFGKSQNPGRKSIKKPA